jgi:DNA polymerase III delta subunit
VAKLPFSPNAVPAFADAPPVVLVTGDVAFFVEEAAGVALDRLAGASTETQTETGTEVLRFDAEAPLDAIADALLNRSLFSPRRVVCADVGRILGTEAPNKLLAAALEAWSRESPAGKREAFRHVRALLTALDVSSGGDPAELAEAVARKVRRKDDAPALADLLRELPEERASPAVLQSALRRLLERGPANEGTVALLTATSPPSGAGLAAEIGKAGLVLEASVGKGSGDALVRLARARAKEREVSVDGDAVQRLLLQTDGDPSMFAAELDKLLDIAGPGGRVSAGDVRENVEDQASEDVYPFFDAIGRRDAADALGRLARIFSDRPVRAGERAVDTDGYWPVIFLGMASTEIRRMLMVRSILGDRFDARMSYQTFQARVLPRMEQPAAPFGRSPFANVQGQISGYLWYKAAQRGSRYTVAELARSLARAADVDVALKNSTPPLEVLTAWVAELVAGES